MRTSLRIFALMLVAAVAAACGDSPDAVAPDGASFARGGQKGSNNDNGNGDSPSGERAALGAALFFDTSLSLNGDQACSTCHEPDQGFAAPAIGVSTRGSVVEGSVAGAFGDRKPPSAAYATLAPIFDPSGTGATGGNFWDGRATGETLGNPAADQALGPFLNPAEQAMPDAACVIWRVSQAVYHDPLWVPVWETDLTEIAFPENVEEVCETFHDPAGEYVDLGVDDRQAVEVAYDRVALAIAAFEDSLNAFSSRFDNGELSAVEAEGEKLFSSKGKCHQCHDSKGDRPLFTDFQYHNLGVPRNPDHPVYSYDDIPSFDPGLGGFTDELEDLGRFKTPTVRNVAAGTNRTYMHNGSLVSLRHVVEFYNTRDVLPTCGPDQLDDPAEWGPSGAYDCWPAPEYPENLDTKNMGNLGLTPEQVDAIVAFMEALTDR